MERRTSTATKDKKVRVQQRQQPDDPFQDASMREQVPYPKRTGKSQSLCLSLHEERMH